MAKYIVTAFVLFASFIFYMVAQTFRQPVNMVSKTYYTEELQYDKLQKANQRWVNLNVHASVLSKVTGMVLSFDSFSFDSSRTLLFSNTGKASDLPILIRTPHSKVELPLMPGADHNYLIKFKGYLKGELYYFEKPL